MTIPGVVQSYNRCSIDNNSNSTINGIVENYNC